LLDGIHVSVLRGDTVPTVVQQHKVPEAINAIAMAKPDYVDLFTATTSGSAERSPEDWARALVEGAAGLSGQFVWRAVLGLRLEPRRSPDSVGGWRIADRGDSWLIVEASSWFLTAHVVLQIGDGQVSVATIVRYDRPIAALIWSPVSVIHRQAMPGLLRNAKRRINRANSEVP
jgi:hypothetical protein